MKKTLVVFLLDETGSMFGKEKEVVRGYNKYIGTLKDSGKDIRFTFIKFDSTKIETVHSGVEISSVPEISTEEYRPGAMTPLYDTIGRTIKATEKLAKKKTAVLFVVLTDGLENWSKEFTKSNIVDLIKKKTKSGWTFAYLGADQDAWKVTVDLGYHKGNTISVDSADYAHTFHVLSKSTSGYLCNDSMQTNSFFVDEESTTVKSS